MASEKMSAFFSAPLYEFGEVRASCKEGARDRLNVKMSYQYEDPHVLIAAKVGLYIDTGPSIIQQQLDFVGYYGLPFAQSVV